MNDEPTCDMCVDFDESYLGPGVCRWASTKLADLGFPRGMVVTRDGVSPVGRCKHFEMSARGIDLCEEYGVRPGVDFPGTLHAGPDVPAVNVGGAS